MNLYCVYSFYKVIRDKVYQKMVEYYNGTYTTVDRLDNSITPSMLDSVYNLISKPSYIIDNIYIGNAYNASNYFELKELNITHIINVSSEISDYYPDDFKYCTIKVLDNNEASLLPHYSTAMEFINEIDTFTDGGNVLIHCFMGSSRSASIVLMYLMREHHMSFDRAYNFLKSKRSIVNLNTKFADELQDWL